MGGRLGSCRQHQNMRCGHEASVTQDAKYSDVNVGGVEEDPQPLLLPQQQQQQPAALASDEGRWQGSLRSDGS